MPKAEPYNHPVSQQEHKAVGPRFVSCFVLTVSDTRTEESDTGGQAIIELVTAAGHIVAGYRIVDVKIDFYDGKMHPVDSNDISFQIAGKAAFREAFTAAKPCLLEPIYNIEIRITEESMGHVIGDLSSRRGKIQGMDSADGYQIVKAQVPQKELYMYATVLRSLTGGRGIHTEEFSHYEEMPREMEAKVVAESKKPAAEAH